MSSVKLTTNNVLSPNFTRAVLRISEARHLSQADHVAAVKLTTIAYGVLSKFKKLQEAGDSGKLSEYLTESVDLEDCSLSSGVVTQAGLSPADTIALGAIIQGG